MVCTVFMPVQKGIEMKLFRGDPFSIHLDGGCSLA